MQYPPYRLDWHSGDTVLPMGRVQYDWESWGERFRAQMKARKLSLARLGTREDAVGVESTLRSYLNNNREISLRDFFRLCQQAGINPHDVLFGPLALTAEETKKVAEVVAGTLSEIRPPAGQTRTPRPPAYSRSPKPQKAPS